MNRQRSTQVTVVLVVVLIAAAGLWSAFTDAKDEGAEAAGNAPDVATEDYDPFGTDGTAAPLTAPDPQAKSTAPKEIEHRMRAPEPLGDPVADGQEVPVTIPYRKGTRTRYRITTVTTTKDLATKSGLAKRSIYDTAIEVIEGDGSGTAVVRLTNEAFEIAAILGTDPAGNAVGFRYDSRAPDEHLLESDPQIKATIRSELTNLDQPLQFRINEKGTPTNAEGVDGWRDRFLAELDRVDPQFRTEAAHAPTAELLEEVWGTHLFPTIGGGTLEGGAERKLYLREDTFAKGYAVHEVVARVTHASDDVVRVEAIGQPIWIERMGPPRSSLEGAIHRCQIVASADSSRFVWHIDRQNGRLLDAYHAVRYRLDRSFRKGRSQGQDTVDDFHRDHTWVERTERVEILPDKPSDGAGDGKDGEQPATEPPAGNGDSGSDEETESADAHGSDTQGSDDKGSDDKGSDAEGSDTAK